VQAEQGECEIEEMYPGDDYGFFGTPTNYTVLMACDMDISTTSKLKFTFQSEFNISRTVDCEVWDEYTDEEYDWVLNEADYLCVADETERTITISEFTTEDIPANRDFIIAFDGVQNPIVYEDINFITVELQTSTGATLAIGYYYFDDEVFNYTNIE
jgi:hypothetical protein